MDGREGIKVKLEKLLEEPELRNNPFRVRLCQIFSTEPVGSPTWGDLSFDEFVDLFNCLSRRSSDNVKMQTSFRLYDFDGDGYLSPEDLRLVLETVATPRPKAGKEAKCLLLPTEVVDIVDRVMRDVDIDGNNRLSYSEFVMVMSRIPDFSRNFSTQAITN